MLRGLLCCVFVGLIALMSQALAHDVSDANARFVEAVNGPAPIPFLYLGAKHMVTGYDHVFFLIGVVFFLRRLRDILLYVSLFTAGHSLTLLFGVLADISINQYIVDAVIGLSVVYKAFENIGGFERIVGGRLDMRYAVFGFGLIHGLGLAGKLQELAISKDGLVLNILSFNLGVEIGQVLVLALVVALLNMWRERPRFEDHALIANTALMAGGFTLIGMHLYGLMIGGAG